MGVVMAGASTKKWWKNAIVYQINPRTYCDSNEDSVGDVLGIISKLQYIKNLAMDAIMLDSIYQDSDFKSINPKYGTMEDMERLISKAKRLGIKIIMKFSLAYTSSEHEWFKKALAGDIKYKEYYCFSMPDSRKRPNNWSSLLGGSAWTKTSSGEYYLHLLNEDCPALNWNNPELFDEMAEVMRFWLDKGVAGFRCDLINTLYKNAFDNGKRHIDVIGKEYYVNTEGCHDILRRLNNEVWSKYKTFIVGEIVLSDPAEVQDFCDETKSEIDAVAYPNHNNLDIKRDKRLSKIKLSERIKRLDTWQNELDFLANSLAGDNANYSGKYKKKVLELLCGLNLSLRGVPFIGENEEIEISDFFKDMVNLRKNSNALKEGSYRRVASPNDVYIFTRESVDERVYIYCNLSSANRSVEFYGDNIIFGNYDESERESFFLKPYEFRVVTSNF